MRILCRHGHFAFYQGYPGEMAEFMDYWKVELERSGEFYTFPLLAKAPKYSIQGKPYLGLPAKVTFEGEPWEVLRENGFVFSVALKRLVPKEAVVTPLELAQTEFYYLADFPLIQPGARLNGRQVLSYDALYNDALIQTKVSELSYE